MTLILITITAFFATLIGGLFTLHSKDRLHMVIGFSAGAIFGLTFFDLIPEALELTSSFYLPSTILAITVIGFALYLILDRTFFMHSHDHEHTPSPRGRVGAGSLSSHSFLDGVGIGLAFHVSVAVGAVVAVAVLVHDFSDGVNTVNYILKNKGTKKEAFKWLLIDALAPVLGVISTFFFTVPSNILGLLLALFAGFFLYIGASDLIPESYHEHPTYWTTVMTVCGMLVMYIVIQLAGL